MNGVLIADEMGLGKTIQAIGVSNAIESIRRILIICPASLKLNWAREWKKWDIKGLSVQIINGQAAQFFTGDVIIINFELLQYHAEELRQKEWDLMIVDECHYLKTQKADRTLEVFGGIKRNKDKTIKKRYTAIPAARRVLMTGTPIVNRPKELWPLIQALDPDGLGSDWFRYATRYCQGRPIVINGERRGFWWAGAANLDELQEIMRSRFMVRRLKKDVLKDLPAKRRQVIVLEPNARLATLVAREKKDYEFYARVSDTGPLFTPAFEQISELRKKVAVGKVPFVVEYIKEVLDETEKVVVFAHHHEVIDRLASAFDSSGVVLDGRTSSDVRQANIDRFQTDPSCRIFIGSIQAAGVGITLTAASTVIFAELDWVPGNISQAEDRCHRIGQKEQVLVQHLVLENSLDEQMIETLIKKQEVIDKALDREVA